jgi:hypothetical protein
MFAVEDRTGPGTFVANAGEGELEQLATGDRVRHDPGDPGKRFGDVVDVIGGCAGNIARRGQGDVDLPVDRL